LRSFYISIKIQFLKGEHIDYCGYSVLPMAVDQDIVSVFAATDDNKVEISNTNPSFQY
jgi:N-acetylgalactosamine kinase